MKVDGQSVPVFYAGLNVYFASFDFTGKADISVASNFDTDKYSAQMSNKEATKVDEKGYWRDQIFVRPLSKNIFAKLEDPVVSFSLSEAGQYSVERIGTSHFKHDAIFFCHRPDTNLPDFTDPNVIH